MARVIAISNKKGGTGKTTTAVNLAAGLAIFEGKKTLLVDADAQANATISLGLLPNTTPSIVEVLVGKAPLDKSIKNIITDNLFILPANTNLSKVEFKLFYQKDGEYLLKRYISAIRKEFDFVIIDCPPAINMMCINSLISADEVIIPLKKEFLPMEGANQFFQVVMKIIEKKNPSLRLDGVVFVATSPTSSESSPNSVYFGSVSIKKFNTEIRYDQNLAEAPRHGKPIFLYSPSSKGAEDYKKLVEEVCYLEVYQKSPYRAP